MPNTKFCNNCGKEQSQYNQMNKAVKRVGYSSNIHDRSIAKYIKSTRGTARWFVLMVAIVFPVAFYIYANISDEIASTEALLYGVVLALMYLVFAMVVTKKKATSKTWDGVVANKKIAERSKHQVTMDSPYNIATYYEVIIKGDHGESHTIRSESDVTAFNYFDIGDRVRFHGGLNSIEKFDKTGDEIVFCNGCHQVNDINVDYCTRCNLLLLK